MKSDKIKGIIFLLILLLGGNSIWCQVGNPDTIRFTSDYIPQVGPSGKLIVDEDESYSLLKDFICGMDSIYEVVILITTDPRGSIEENIKHTDYLKSAVMTDLNEDCSKEIKVVSVGEVNQGFDEYLERIENEEIKEKVYSDYRKLKVFFIKRDN